MFEPLVLAAAIILGMTLLRQLRRPGGAPALYTLIIGAILVMAFAGLGEGGRAWGIAAITLCGLTVVLPWLLGGLAKRLFARGKMGLAVKVAGARSTLMPGSGLARHQEILRGLGVLASDGVDAALGHFRGLLQETEDRHEEAVIHEQIVSMLFYAQRWREGIAHFEGHFPVGFAALRPSLALGLLRAYGEEGELESAAGLLRVLESGPLAGDPAAADVLGQARLTFLAYSGASSYVDLAIGHHKLLGMSAASAALFRGIALARAGAVDEAIAELGRVSALAGPDDDRVVAASRSGLARVHEAALDPGPELRRYAAAVGERLRALLSAGKAPRRRSTMLATYGLSLAMIAGYVALLVGDRGGLGLIALGGFTEGLWAAGSWGRLFTAPFIHADLISLVLDLYSIWLAGHIIERLQGSGRMLVIALGGAAFGLWAAALARPDGMAILSGGPAMAVAVVVGALWTLMPLRSPAITARARRSLMLTLLLLLGAQLLACLPALVGLEVAPLSLGGAALVATLAATVLPGQAAPSWLRRGFAAVALALLGTAAVGASHVYSEDVEGFLVAHREVSVSVDGVRIEVPRGFRRTAAGEEWPASLPVGFYPGLRDETALHGGAIVQIAVARPRADEPAIFALDPALIHEITLLHDDALPAALRDGLDAAGGRWRTYLLARNGEAVARVIEREVGGGARVVLVSAPAAAIDHAPRLYAAILGDAATIAAGEPGAVASGASAERAPGEGGSPPG